MKTFLNWKSSQRQHSTKKHLPPLAFHFLQQKVNFSLVHLESKGELGKMREGRQRQTLGREASELLSRMSLRAKDQIKSWPVLQHLKQGKLKYTWLPRHNSPNKLSANCPSRKSALLLASSNFISSCFQVKSLLLSYKHHKRRNLQPSPNYRFRYP